MVRRICSSLSNRLGRKDDSSYFEYGYEIYEIGLSDCFKNGWDFTEHIPKGKIIVRTDAV